MIILVQAGLLFGDIYFNFLDAGTHALCSEWFQQVAQDENTDNSDSSDSDSDSGTGKVSSNEFTNKLYISRHTNHHESSNKSSQIIHIIHYCVYMPLYDTLHSLIPILLITGTNPLLATTLS